MRRLLNSFLAASLLLIPSARADEAKAPAGETASAAPAAKEPAAEHPVAGFGNEAFYLRSPDDNFILLVGGRLHEDYYGFEGGARQPLSGFQVRRARIELFGTFLKHWDFQISADFAGGAPSLTDGWINANFTPFANVQIGQFDAPFTMENRTGDKWTDLQERSVVTRAFGIPENKMLGAMVWGQPEAKFAYWSLGVLNGEGTNLTHRSNAFDVMGRAWFAPLGLAKMEMFKNVWLGGSFWSGYHAPTIAGQIDRLAMKTQGGYTFFNSVAGTVHEGDRGSLLKWAVELNAPIGPFVLKSEYVHDDERLRELDGTTFVRNGSLSGGAWYARLSWFAWGDPLINGLAGMQVPARLVGDLKPGKTETALQLVAEFDQIAFNVTGDGEPTNDKFAGKYGLNVLAVGVNYWYTKHVRLTGNFLYNMFSGRVVTPRVSGPTSWEFTLRAALAL